MLRLIPMGITTFITLFGSKIAATIRLLTVFWASTSPILVATLAPHMSDPDLPWSPTTVMGIGSALYCGGVGTFAAIKKPVLGVGVQGMAVGATAAVIVEAFVMSHISDWMGPEAAEAMLPWVQMAFRMSCGGVVVKLFLKFEEARDLVSTVVSGGKGGVCPPCVYTFACIGRWVVLTSVVLQQRWDPCSCSARSGSASLNRCRSAN
jgi:hypothetical protein